MSISALLDAMRGDTVSSAAPQVVDTWSERHQRHTLEPVPDHPGQWQEPAASAAYCTFCPEPLAEGDKIACPVHRQALDVTAQPSAEDVAVTRERERDSARADLLALAEAHEWQALPFKSGQAAGGTGAMWRTFAKTAPGDVFRLAVNAATATWGTVAADHATTTSEAV